ncbi:hypothetical protein VZC37_24540 [Gordonia sp. LSe1-13]|uniref:Uncharacterized protein n=2 Tax=Gordonia sesuvii TaxID=3116777 RepID=A0ABU7MK82_9ACTN|nr:hypothetical protein [Gordonia sp. LSe1-13]
MTCRAGPMRTGDAAAPTWDARRAMYIQSTVRPSRSLDEQLRDTTVDNPAVIIEQPDNRRDLVVRPRDHAELAPLVNPVVTFAEKLLATAIPDYRHVVGGVALVIRTGTAAHDSYAKRQAGHDLGFDDAVKLVAGATGAASSFIGKDASHWLGRTVNLTADGVSLVAKVNGAAEVRELEPEDQLLQTYQQVGGPGADLFAATAGLIRAVASVDASSDVDLASSPRRTSDLGSVTDFDDLLDRLRRTGGADDVTRPASD